MTRIGPFLAAGLLLFSLLTFSSHAAGQDGTYNISPDAETYLNHVLDLMQQNALHKKSIDWPTLRKAAFDRAKGAQTSTDTYPAIAYAISQLQEHHTWFQIPDNLGGEKRRTITAEIMKIEGRSEADPKRSPFAPRKEMEGHIELRDGKAFAYVVVPMCIPQYSEWEKNAPYFAEFAEKLHKIVVDLQSQKPQGWIIDLRGNQGGNMWPMLAGIGAIVGEGDLGTTVTADDERTSTFYKDGKAGERNPDGTEDISASIKDEPFVLPHQPWVAVLFDHSTGSSGEAIAISFVGRPRERSFGERTAGFSTANQMYSLSDGASLFLCNGIAADRTGKLYPDGLDPDVKVADPETKPATQEDPAVTAAEDWLAAQAGNSAGTR